MSCVGTWVAWQAVSEVSRKTDCYKIVLLVISSSVVAPPLLSSPLLTAAWLYRADTLKQSNTRLALSLPLSGDHHWHNTRHHHHGLHLPPQLSLLWTIPLLALTHHRSRQCLLAGGLEGGCGVRGVRCSLVDRLNWTVVPACTASTLSDSPYHCTTVPHTNYTTGHLINIKESGIINK